MSHPHHGITLTQSEERFRFLVESVQDYAIFILDPDGHIASWNNGAQRLKGYSASEILGRHFSIFYPPEAIEIRHPWNELEIAAAEGRYHEEGWRIRKDGSRFWASVVITALRDNKGELTGFAKVTRDMTERREAEEQLERRVEERTAELETAMKRVEALNVQLQRAMRETHHRVKNNLQVVSAMIDIQLQSHADKGSLPVSEIERLRNHIRTLATVHDLLTQRIREDESEQRLSVKGVLDSLLPLLRQTVGNATLDYAVADGELSAKQCIALSLVLNELVSNAVRHGGKEVEVRFNLSESEASLTVADNGPGFPAAFDPLEQSNLGLDLILSLAATDLKGHVQFHNRKGGGAVVEVTFPVTV